MTTVKSFTLALATLVGLGACGDDSVELGETVHVATATQRFLTYDRHRDVDILFVIDNSRSMAEEQAVLAANFGAFLEVLDSEEVEIDYRIAITTTDSGNPACDPELTTPERGALVMSSCTERLDEFVIEPEPGVVIDARGVGCSEICTLDGAALELLPTTTSVDKVPRSRPWIERIDGQSNLPLGTSAAEAFGCFGPQGISGCGFEAPLESMYGALTRAQNELDPAYGFMRHDAILAVIFVTDEVDCSHAEAFASVFELDPSAGESGSALCWDMGVSCVGEPSGYDTCDPVNVGTKGELGVADEDAVLRPLSRYRGLLDGLEREKRRFDPNAEIVVALIGGVGGNGQPFYADVGDSDPEFQDRFGIGPGCQSASPGGEDPAQAVPPVRLRELVDAFTPDNMFSICDADHTAALEAFIPWSGTQIAPACYDYCAEDTDLSTAALEPDCVVELDPFDGGEAQKVMECERDAGGYVLEADDYAMPDEGVDVCYAMLTDSQGATASTADDLSYYCADEGHNLEFKLARRPGAPGEPASLMVTCTLTESAEADCPGLGD